MNIAPPAEIKDRLRASVEAAKESATHYRRFIRVLTQARERVHAGHYVITEQFWRELRRPQIRHGPRQPSRQLAKTAWPHR